jgi:hypothetical protein
METGISKHEEEHVQVGTQDQGTFYKVYLELLTIRLNKNILTVSKT